MDVVRINKLNKTYPSFKLDDVCFAIEDGKITGFVGRNGAGKTTTIKSMLNIVHPDSGNIEYFGMSLLNNENEIKSKIGYSTGTISWFPRNKIKDIVSITKIFYETWDDASYQKYLKMFGIDENKMPIELSEGMKVKCNLMIALSHKSKVLILDEPTSGLDPFSRDELIEIFKELKKDGVAIFFSTHIISDLEKCADNIVYISKGKIVAAISKEEFIDKYSKENETLEETILRMERGIDNE